MECEGLSPCVKHAQDAGLDLEATARDVNQGRSGSTEQQVVEDTLCVQSKDVEPLGHGEDDVEIGHGEELRASCLEPSGSSRSTATGAGAVAAGMPLNVLEAAAVTHLLLPTEGGCAACADRTQGFALRSRSEAVTQEGLAPNSYDRAEISLGGHVLPG